MQLAWQFWLFESRGVGRVSFVKDSGNAPGSSEKTGGGGSHEDSGSICVDISQSESANADPCKQAIHRGNLARKAIALRA